jgi:Zn finger protein HypA/HybF involved in hydrogenase expression
MKEACWKIRNLKDTPRVILSTVGKRQARRDKHARQELLAIQCAQCRLMLHRGFLP